MLAYRLILWVPLIVGVVSLVELRRALRPPQRRDLADCKPIPANA